MRGFPYRVDFRVFTTRTISIMPKRATGPMAPAMPATSYPKRAQHRATRALHHAGEVDHAVKETLMIADPEGRP